MVSWSGVTDPSHISKKGHRSANGILLHVMHKNNEFILLRFSNKRQVKSSHAITSYISQAQKEVLDQ